MDASDAGMRDHLRAGQVIPAHPLALTSTRALDERHQRALTRYYIDAGAGGIAVGVHTTQFAIRQPAHGLYRPVLELAAETARAWRTADAPPFALVAGVIGDTRQAIAEASLARALGFHAALLGLGSLPQASEDDLIAHCRAVGEVMPIFGFYLQPAVGGRVLSYAFWRRFAELSSVWAIKIAPFNRYQTIDVVRAVADAGRDDVALYTGNDDSIVTDLLTPFPVLADGRAATRRIVGGLLGQWAVWTHAAVALHARARQERDRPLDPSWLRDGAALTDANAAVFDAAHAFAGCIPGIHEVLRRQGLLRGSWCLDPHEVLSIDQASEIDRVCRQYPELIDDEFVQAHLHRWLA